MSALNTNGNDQPTILGVYSSGEQRMLGQGGTAQEESGRILWFALKLGPACQVQPLSTLGLPSGVKKTVKEAEFRERFKPEPGLFASRILPALLGLLEKFDPERGPDLERLTSEEKAVYKAIRPSEATQKSVRGTVSPDRMVHAMLTRLSSIQDSLIFSQGADLNLGGIDARRRGDLDAALENYLNALEVLPQDEHLLFNIARAYFERGDVRECLDALNRALELVPDFEAAIRFKRHVADHLHRR